jgi:hypothetical protein
VPCHTTAPPPTTPIADGAVWVGDPAANSPYAVLALVDLFQLGQYDHGEVESCHASAPRSAGVARHLNEWADSEPFARPRCDERGRRAVGDPAVWQFVGQVLLEAVSA